MVIETKETAQYTPEDFEFFSFLNDSISETLAIPLELPLKAMHRLTVQSSLWFYEWYPDATQETRCAIKNSDILGNFRLNGGMNAKVILPNSVESIFRLYDTNAAVVQVSASSRQLLTIPILNSLSYTAGGNFQSASSAYYQYSLADGIIAMYEMANVKSRLTKGVQFQFNNKTHLLSIMGRPAGDIVLDVMERIPLQNLYADYYFREYCIGQCKKSLGTILTTFNYQLPGNVTVDFAALKDEGGTIISDTQQAIKDMNNSDFVFTV